LLECAERVSVEAGFGGKLRDRHATSHASDPDAVAEIVDTLRHLGRQRFLGGHYVRRKMG